MADYGFYFANAPAVRSAQEHANAYLAGQGQALQNQAAEAQLEQQRRQVAKEQNIQEIAKKYASPEGFDRKGFLSELYTVDPMGAQALSHQMQQEDLKTQQLGLATQKESRAADAQKIKNTKDYMEMIGQSANSILQLPPEQQPMAYKAAIQNARSLAQRFNVEPPEMPEEFPGPDVLKSFVGQTVSIKDQLDKVYKDWEMNKPQTEMERMKAALKAGRITQAEYDAWFKKATTHTPGTQVNVSNKQESEEAKAIGKDIGEQYADIQKAGVVATNQLASYGRMKQLLKGMETGKLTPTIMNIKAIGDSLGFKVNENLGTMQAIQSLGNQMALELRNPAGGAGMPGSLSDSDRNYLVSMVPGLEKTPEGNKQILDMMIKVAERKAQVARMAREYRAKNKTFEGFPDYLANWAEKNPLFKENKSNQQLGMGTSSTGEVSSDELMRLMRGGK